MQNSIKAIIDLKISHFVKFFANLIIKQCGNILKSKNVYYESESEMYPKPSKTSLIYCVKTSSL